MRRISLYAGCAAILNSDENATGVRAIVRAGGMHNLFHAGNYVTLRRDCGSFALLRQGFRETCEGIPAKAIQSGSLVSVSKFPIRMSWRPERRTPAAGAAKLRTRHQHSRSKSCSGDGATLCFSAVETKGGSTSLAMTVRSVRMHLIGNRSSRSRAAKPSERQKSSRAGDLAVYLISLMNLASARLNFSGCS